MLKHLSFPLKGFINKYKSFGQYKEEALAVLSLYRDHPAASCKWSQGFIGLIEHLSDSVITLKRINKVLWLL